MATPLKARVMLARNDKIDAALAASALESAMADGNGFVYIASVAVMATDWNVAHAVGIARTTIAKAANLNSSKHRRGAETDERIDTEGAIGEWLVAGLLAKAGADVAALVAFKAPKGEVDLLLDGKRIDVKTIGQTSGRNCNINREQHHCKRPDAYLIVHLVDSGTADLFVVNAAEVGAADNIVYGSIESKDTQRFQLRQGYSPFYCRYMAKQLENLPEPEEVTAV